MGPWARWHCVIYSSIYNGGGQCSGDTGAEQNRKRQVGSGKWAVLWAEIKSLFNLAKPGLGSEAVVPSTNVKEIKWRGENHVKWGLALAQEWPEQEWPQVNAHSGLSLLVLSLSVCPSLVTGARCRLQGSWGQKQAGAQHRGCPWCSHMGALGLVLRSHWCCWAGGVLFLLTVFLFFPPSSSEYN